MKLTHYLLHDMLNKTKTKKQLFHDKFKKSYFDNFRSK